ncbi:D-alanyl-D-alanine carboxypeptidase family protein [Peribacillus deserti]|uniref:serine-type D-Ala-D-Ala carboxypeptidase n=1 Tax=Peribacillus deserti TaxID=673318 RepID=A0A2N5M1M0_9BACI|nr:D-alanyl-D-alanine carboxypeptidase family protein [Peribacillus deserti]PLT28268.1 D-alanyl-D-alanine carboxypeptidase [Peribacillus deserti]
MKRLLIIGILFFVSFGLAVPKSSAEGSAEQLADNARSAILIERDTGKILYDKESHVKLPPASMTKIMTMLLIMEAIENGKLSMNEKIRTSEYAASMGGSQIFLEPGEEMTAEQMLKGIAIGSGNDAAVAMAERIAGSVDAFVDMMNNKAKELGLTHTKFQNPTGLPTKDHYSTAFDMAMMAKELLKYDGKITKFTGTYEDYLREDTDKKFWLVNTNRLVKFYPGVDGLKTGFTQEAKYCLTATAKKNNMRVIAVIFGAPTPKDRNAQITSMLDYAFSHYQTYPVYKRGEKLTDVFVSKGSRNKVEGVTGEPISILAKKGETKKGITKKVVLNKDLKAPVYKGERIGTLLVMKDGKTVSESAIVANSNVQKASWWKNFKQSFSMFTRSE